MNSMMSTTGTNNVLAAAARRQLPSGTRNGARSLSTAWPASKLAPSASRTLATAAYSSPVAANRTGGKTAIVMLNMGGPSTLPEVGDFLSRLFHDRELIQLPFQSSLAPLIARRRTPKIVDQYAKIGGGSPILKWTRQQGEEMVRMLDELHPSTAPHKPYVAFRYARPLTEEMLDELAADGVTRAVAFTQYPQYSCSTTGSNLNELYRQIQNRVKAGDQEIAKIEWSVIDRWPAHPGLVQAFTNRVEAILSQFSEEERHTIPIMFSAHSLPMQIVSGRGDPYPQEVASTVHAIMSKLGFRNPYRLTWQSQVGPSAWLGPQTSDTVKGWAKQGYKHAIAVPVAFTQDHIETLYELDIELKEEAEEHGMTLHRAESLNLDPTFLRALADVAASHLSALLGDPKQTSSPLPGELQGGPAGTEVWNQGKTSRQMQIRCPGCTNKTCGEAKRFFAGGTIGVGEDAFAQIGQEPRGA